MNKVYKVIWSKAKNCYVVASELAKSHTKAPKSGVMSRALVAGVLACVLSCGAVMPAYAAYYDTIDYSQSNTYTADTFTNHAFNEVGNGTDLSITGNISLNGFSSSAPNRPSSSSPINQSYLVNSLGFNTGKFVVTKASTNVKTTTTNGYTVPEYRFKDLNTAIRILSVSGKPIGENSSTGTIFRANPADYINIQQYNGKYYVIGMTSGVNGTSNKRALGYARDIDGKSIQSVFIVQLVQKDGYIETDTRYVDCGGPVVLKPIETLVTAFNNASVTRTYASVGEELSIFGKYSPDISVTDNSSLNLTGSAALADGNLTVSNNSLASVSSDLSASKVSLSGGSTVTSGGTLSAKSIVDSGTGTNTISAASIQTTEGDINTPNTDVTATDSVESAGVVKLKSLNAPRLLGAGSGMSTLGGGLTVAGQVKGVTAGTADTDAVNVKQLNDAIAGAGSSSSPLYLAGGASSSNSSATSYVGIGSNSIINSNKGVVIGDGSLTNTQAGLVVVGSDSLARGARSVALGSASVATTNDTVSFGHKDGDEYLGGTYSGNLYRRLINVADGTDDHDVATVGQVKGNISGLSVSGKTITYTKVDGTTGTITTQDTDTHYTTHLYAGSGTAANAATTNGNTKITVADNSTVNNSVTIKGTGATTVTSDANGVITVNSTDNNTTYSAGAGLSLSGTTFSVNTNGSVASGNTGVLNGGTVYSEVRPTADGTFVKKANTTAANITALDTAAKNAIKALSVSGQTITYTKGDGTTGTITTQDNNTTYSAFTGATSSAAGTAGLVKAPAAGDQNKFLRGDGTWAADNNTTYSAGTGLSLSGTTFSVNTNGSIASGNTGVLNGGTVYSEVRPTADGTFAKKANTTAANITALDTAAKNAIKGLSVSGQTITYTKGDGTTGTITTQDTNTTYDNMSATELSTGTATTARSISAKTIADYVTGKVSAETTARASAISSEATTRANADTALGTRIDGTIKDLSVNGRTITYTKGDGTTGTITTQDSNTTYDAMSASELSTGTATTARTVTAKVLGDYVTGKVSAETTARTTAINSEATTRANADTALGTRIDNVTSAYQSADTGLSNRLGSVASDGTFIKKSATNNVATNLTALDTAAKNAIKDLSVSGTTITYTKGDGTTGTITTQDTNTTYANMTASELETGTATAARSISAKVLADYVNSRVGDSTVSTGSTGSTAVGDSSVVTGNNSVSVGDNSSVTGTGSVSVGTGSSVEGDSNVSIGNNGSVSGSNSVAIGSDTETTESNAVAVGGGSSATGEGAVSLGAGTSATGDNSTALGNNSYSANDNAVALGSNAVASASDVVSVGHKAGDTDAEGNVYTTNEYRRIINVANGVNANDAATVGQMNTAINTETSARTAADTALGARIDGTIKGLSVNGRTITYTKGDGTTGTITTQDTTYSAGSGLSLSNGAFSVVTDGQVAQGNTGIVTGGTVYEALEARIGQITVENNAQNTVAVGDNSSVSGDGAVAVGTGSSSSGEGSVAVGDTSSSTGQGSVAVGGTSSSAGEGSVAVGDTSTSSGDGSVAVGSNSKAESDNTVVIGTGSAVSGTDSDNSVAIGQQTNVTGSDSVALGGGSSVTGIESTAVGGNTVVNNSSSVALGYDSNASNDNVVSVGHKATDTDSEGNAYGNDLTRRIINVADGVDAHDVVTVGQMNQQLATINNYNTTLDARLGNLASDGNYIRSSATNDVAANLLALDTQLKATDVSSLKYDGADHSLVTMGGTSGTKLTNLKHGTLSDTSTDAVTGAQLYAVKQDITGFAADINRNKQSIRDMNSSISTALESVSSTSTLVDTIDNLKADTSLNNLTAAGQQVITNAAVNAVQEYMASQAEPTLGVIKPKLMGSPRLMAVNPAPADTNYVVYDDTTADTITLEGAVGTGTKITNVAEAELSAASMDAVNGSQLYAVTQQFDEFQSALSKNNTSIARAQTDINNIKTTNLNLQSAVNTLNTQMEAGMNVTIDGAMVKNVNPESNYVNFVTGDNIALSNDNGSLKISAKSDGVVTNGNTGLVSGGTVYNAIQDALAGYGGEAGTALAGKANTDASNIGKNADTDNSTAWGHALGTGTVAQNDDRLVTGKTMYDELRAGDGNYVKNDKTTGQNLQALDTAVGGLQDTVTGMQDDITGIQDDITGMQDDITGMKGDITGMKGDITGIRSDLDGKADKDLSNLSDSARDVIRTLAQDGIDVTSADSSVGVAKSVADGRTVFDLTVVKNGKVEEGNTGILTGDTVYQAIKDINPYGDNVITGTDSGAVGKRNTVAGNGSYVVGNDNTVADGSDDMFILGSNVNATGHNSVVLGKDSDGSQDNVVSVGAEGKERRIVHVADGAIAKNSKDAVNGGQLYDVREDLRQAKDIDTDAWSKALGTGEVAEGNTGLVNGGTVYDAIQKLDTTNGAIVPDADTGEIRIGGTSRYDSFDTVNIAKADGTARVLRGVATDPNDPSSAANVGYVNAIGQNIVNGVNEGFTRVNDRMDKVGAGAAAMAGLVPGPMEGDEKWSLSAAVGNYRSATAGAVGAFYKPTENVVLAVKGAFGNGENMVSGGIGVTLNKGNVPGVTKAQLVRTVNAQANEIQTMKAAQAQSLTVINEQAARIERLETALQQVLEAQQKVSGK